MKDQSTRHFHTYDYFHREHAPLFRGARTPLHMGRHPPLRLVLPTAPRLLRRAAESCAVYSSATTLKMRAFSSISVWLAVALHSSFHAPPSSPSSPGMTRVCSAASLGYAKVFVLSCRLQDENASKEGELLRPGDRSMGPFFVVATNCVYVHLNMYIYVYICIHIYIYAWADGRTVGR